MMTNSDITKEDITKEALSLGAEFVGYAPADRWHQYSDLPTEFYPDRVWPLCKTVIVLGVPVWLPILEAAPAEIGREQYIITNNLLDEAAYRLAAFLNRNGHASINICRDGYGDFDILFEQPIAIFSHVWAGYYAGLGTIGWNHTLLTKQFGPRVRLVSILTSLAIEGDPMLKDELCVKCLLCKKICPSQAFIGDKDARSGKMDRHAGATNGKRLRQACRDRCGACVKVCPVGEDRKLFKSSNVQIYFKEKTALTQELDNPVYRSWQHIRKYGGHPLKEDQ